MLPECPCCDFSVSLGFGELLPQGLTLASTCLLGVEGPSRLSHCRPASCWGSGFSAFPGVFAKEGCVCIQGATGEPGSHYSTCRMPERTEFSESLTDQICYVCFVFRPPLLGPQCHSLRGDLAVRKAVFIQQCSFSKLQKFRSLAQQTSGVPLHVSPARHGGSSVRRS